MKNVLGVVAMVASVSTGCAAVGASAGDAPGAEHPDLEGQEVSVWADPATAVLVEAAAEAFRADTGGTVDLTIFDEGVSDEDILIHVPAGTGPDIAFVTHRLLDEYIAAGVIESIPQDVWVDDFGPVARDAWSRDGDIYAVPVATSCVALVMRTIFDEPEGEATAGFSPSLSPSVVASASPSEVSSPPIATALAFGPDRMEAAYAVQTTFGGGFDLIFGADYPGVTADIDEFRRFAEFVHADAQTESPTFVPGTTEEDIVAAFVAGEAASVVARPQHLEALREGGIAISVSPVPSIGGEPSVPAVTVLGAVVTSSGRDNGIAEYFVAEYLSQLDSHQSLAEASVIVPAHTGVTITDVAIASYAVIAENGNSAPTSFAAAQAWAVWEDIVIASAQGEVVEESRWTALEELLRVSETNSSAAPDIDVAESPSPTLE